MLQSKYFIILIFISCFLFACDNKSDGNSMQNTVEKTVESTTHNTATDDADNSQADEKGQQKAIKEQDDSAVDDKEDKYKLLSSLPFDKDTQWQKGTVKYFNVEGGFYGIVTDSGKRLLPMNLAKDFQQHGATVKFKGKAVKKITTSQWGTPFSITDMVLVQAGNSSNY